MTRKRRYRKKAAQQAEVHSEAPSTLSAEVYSGPDWSSRLDLWLSKSSAYRRANVQRLYEALGEETAGARMVVNIGAWSLLRFLFDGIYKNAYDLVSDGILPEIGADGADPESQRRAEVDRLMGFDDPAHIYFGAAALESAGVRFYGEYCMVLREVPSQTQILDRDSFEFIFPPLADEPQRKEIVRALLGIWPKDLLPIAAFKIRDVIDQPDRLSTEGRMRDGILRGEEYIEVHREGTFRPQDLAEVRQAATDIAAGERILSAASSGVVPTIEEVVWCCQRAEVERRLAALGIESRVADAAFLR